MADKKPSAVNPSLCHEEKDERLVSGNQNPHGDLVTIPATEYAALIECRRIATETHLRTSLFIKPQRSPIERDSDVAVFLAQRFGHTILADILNECRVRFGASRTPSRSSAHRYWMRLRAAMAHGRNHSKP